jgi:hypothetical protein
VDRQAGRGHRQHAEGRLLVSLYRYHHNSGNQVAIDSQSHALASRPYLADVRQPANGYVSVDIPIGDAMELSARAR